MTPDKVSYCVNTWMCGRPINEGHDLLHCADCGAELLVQGRYRLIKALHKNASDPNKVVYLATDKNSKKYILKIIDFPKSALEKYLKREYDFLMRVGEPFPRINEDDFFHWAPDPEQDFFFVSVLVLPFIEGQDSADWIQEHGAISEAECMNWLKQILNYLEIFSDISTLYRDMKPENIIVTSDKTIKLIDFGSIREIDKEYLSILDENIFDGYELKRGTQIFTFGYSPPEQLRGFAVPQSDFYALGRTAIYWLTGKAPVDLDRSDSPNWQECCDVSQTFKNFIDWLTADQASARPVNARAIRHYLEHQYLIDLEREQSRQKRRLFRDPNFYKWLAVSIGVIGLAWFGIIQLLYSQGIEAYQQTQYRRAIDKFQQVTKLNPGHGGAWYFLGLNCQRVGDIDCAVMNYKKSIRKSVNPAGPEYQMGVIWQEQSEYDEARRYYQASLASQANNPEALNRIARLDIRNGDFASAKKAISTGLKYAEDDEIKARLLSQKGRIYYKEGRFQEAEQILGEAIDLKVTAESVCLLPKIKEQQNADQDIIKSLWYNCFYASSETDEGDSLKSELLTRLNPPLFFGE